MPLIMQLFLDPTGNTTSRDMGLVEIDSDVMEPKEIIILWNNWPSPTVPM